MRSPRFRHLVPAVSLLTTLCFGAAHAQELEFRVRVLHTTDLHGSLAAWDDWNDRPAAKGLERIASLVARARADSGGVLLVDAGDALFGSPLKRVWHEGPRTMPEPVVAAMNALGYDAMAIGNHEFDAGRGALDSAATAARFPFLAANAVDAKTGKPAFGSTVVREVNGVRIGIVGLTTAAMGQLVDSAYVANLRFLDPLEVARSEVARLRGAERCHAVIALFHSGLERDPAARGGEGRTRVGDIPNENLGYRLAYEVPGLDVVILGHTHQVLHGVTIGGALVTQAGKFGESLGRVDLTFKRTSTLAEWKLDARTSSVLAITDSIPAEPAIRELVAPYAAATRTALDVVVAQADSRIAAPLGRFGDSPLARIVHRCQLEWTNADVSLATLFDPAQVIAQGPIRRRDLLRLYPYDNNLVMVELSGADLKAVLEHAGSMLNEYVWDGTTPVMRPDVAGYQFESAYGVQYELDLTRPAGSRVTNLRFQGKPLAPDAKLRVVTNSYRLAGGGDYLPLRRAKRLWYVGHTVPEYLEKWVRREGSLRAEGEPGWTVLPDYAGSLERPLVDRLVRHGVAPRAQVMRLGAALPARRVDLIYWLARAFDMRSKRPSGAWNDVPDSLQVWLDGILAKGILGPLAAADRIEAEKVADISLALDWSERTARAHKFELAAKGVDPAFRRSLFTGVSGPGPRDLRTLISRAQWLGVVANLRFPSVRVLETTDFHGAILGGTRERRSQRPIGGSIGLAAAIERERAQNPEGTVLLDGGDLFQGPMISNLQFGRPVVEQMNLLGYTAAAVGNHEFDWGVDTLVKRVREMKFAALGANMVERKTNKLPRWVRSDTTVTRRGVRVGIVGLSYPGTPRVTMPANVAHLRFDDDSTTAANVSQRLRKQGAAVVLGVGHIPADTDSTRRARGDLVRLAKISTVDAWFGGHSHNVVEDRFDGRPILIAGSQGQYLAMADLVVDPLKKRVVETQSRVITVYADGTPDSAWSAHVARWNADVAPIAAEVIGDATVALHRRRPESTIGNFICDAMRADAGVDIALQNPGGMRADLDAGPITRGDVYAVMPFDNTIVTMDLTGEQVKLALEQALRGSRVTQVSGVRYVVDAKKPALQRITAITLADGKPLDPQHTYKVAVNNFMASGGDQYDALANGANRSDTGRLIRDAMVKWVAQLKSAGKTLDLQRDGRITSADGASD